MFGQITSKVGRIAEFGHKQVKGFGKRAAHTHPFFSGRTSPGLVSEMEKKLGRYSSKDTPRVPDFGYM